LSDNVGVKIGCRSLLADSDSCSVKIPLNRADGMLESATSAVTVDRNLPQCRLSRIVNSRPGLKPAGSKIGGQTEQALSCKALETLERFSRVSRSAPSATEKRPKLRCFCFPKAPLPSDHEFSWNFPELIQLISINGTRQSFSAHVPAPETPLA